MVAVTVVVPAGMVRVPVAVDELDVAPVKDTA